MPSTMMERSEIDSTTGRMPALPASGSLGSFAGCVTKASIWPAIDS